jgi:hypothetical protein
MGSKEASRLRERAALMRRVAVIRTRGDVEINRELLRQAAALEEQARTLEIAKRNRLNSLDKSGP